MPLKPFIYPILLTLLSIPSLQAVFDINAIEPITNISFRNLYDEAIRTGRPLDVVCLETIVDGEYDEKFYFAQTMPVNPLQGDQIIRTSHARVVENDGVFNLELLPGVGILVGPVPVPVPP